MNLVDRNAGFSVSRAISDTTPDHWRGIMAVNLDSMFLAGDASRCVTGAELVVDGGSTAQ